MRVVLVGRIQQSLAADGAIACFSSSLFPLKLECCSRAAAEGQRYVLFGRKRFA
jgi:hypothetical protein